MDGVSAAGGIFSIVSLAIQFASSVKDTYEFLAAVRDAPSEIQDLVSEIDLLQRILQSILRDVRTSRTSTLLADSVRMCQVRLKKLDDLAKPLKIDLHAGKREKSWRSLKAAFRGNKIEQLRGILESAKTTLLLAKQETLGETISTLHSSIATLSPNQATAVSEAFQSTRQDISGLEQRLGTQLEDHIGIIVRQLAQDTSQGNFSVTQQMLECVISKTVKTAFQESLPAILALETAREWPQKVRELNQASNPPKLKSDLRLQKICSTNSRIPDQSETQREVYSMEHHRNERRFQRKSTTNWYRRYHTIFGIIIFQSNLVSKIVVGEGVQSEFDDPSCSLSIEFSFSLLPKSWLFSYVPLLSLLAIRDHGYRLENSLISYNRVSSDSEIFKACGRGDLCRVQELFRANKASVYDVDDWGKTLLHVSAYRGQLTVCSFLLQNGAKTNVDLGSGTEVFSLLAGLPRVRNLSSGPVNVLRLLVENGSDPTSVLHEGHFIFDVYTTEDYMQCVEYVAHQDYFSVDIDDIGPVGEPPVYQHVLRHIIRKTWNHNTLKGLEKWKHLGANIDDLLHVVVIIIKRKFCKSRLYRNILKDIIHLVPDLHHALNGLTVSCLVEYFGIEAEWYEVLAELGIDLEAFKKEDTRIMDLLRARDDNNIQEVARLEAMAPAEATHSSADFTPARNLGHYQNTSGIKMRRPRVNTELD